MSSSKLMGTDEIVLKADLSGLMNRVCSHLNERYKSDKLVPGVHFAWLPDSSKWYVSIKRFRGGKEDETILTKASESTPEAALERAYNTWVDLVAEFDRQSGARVDKSGQGGRHTGS